MRLALPSLQKDYMWGLFQGKQETEYQLKQAFKEIDISLDAGMPVYLLLGRVDAWKEMFTTPDKALLTYAFQNICDEYLSEHVHCFSVVYDLSKIVWLIQPSINEQSFTASDPLDWVKAYRYASGILETVQETCKKLLNLPVSFILGSEQTAWNGISDRFHSIKYCFVYGHGLSSEVIMTDRDIHEREGHEMGSHHDFFYHTRVQLLMTCLENNHREQFSKLYVELTAIWGDSLTPYERKTSVSFSFCRVSFAH